MKIIDGHMHLWQPALLSYEWLENLPALNRPFLPSDFEAASDSLEVAGAVFVQADCSRAQGLEEVKWVSQVAANAPVHAIVAFAPLEMGEAVRPLLETLAGYPLVKGVRRLIQSEAPGFALQPNFVRGVQALADYDFSFDICIYHYQLPDVIALVAQCPDARFVLDHGGKPGIAAGEIEGWKADIQRLAQYPNVCCKLSGMVTEADHENWTPDDLRPYAGHLLNTFGSDRVLFGSDWPVATLATSYILWVETARDFVDQSSADAHKIFFDNANQFYRLDL